jgi:hypothetical protein
VYTQPYQDAHSAEEKTVVHHLNRKLKEKRILRPAAQ